METTPERPRGMLARTTVTVLLLLGILLGLASVHLDTTPGPVHHSAKHLPVETARPYAETLLGWGSDARRGGAR